ncbi:probable secreted protein [Geminocystis sp. NIES-3708]|uniref:CASTOR/POLLUX-related putative ion channel n=1 Tax=Geminocystis sp. NIES-3708 TaxID=1615909 RepID=UPI0005FC5A44|nr:potassium transporter TrkA [Geminocystis sp. NIES-3708]BAQ60780.1 probable secreted protein [Geminocystis sp. NIES-3708]
MKKVTLLDRLHYAFDNFMAKGTISLIGGLAIISGLFILITAIIITITGLTSPDSSPYSFPEAVWGVLMRTLDTGTVGGDTGWLFRLFMLFVTFGGIFIISTLIGLLSSGIESKLQDLRKGRSQVIENDHIVILGWSFQIFTLLSELILANVNNPKCSIVILSEEDKVEMEENIQKSLNFKYHTPIICRHGKSSDFNDLALVNIQNSRSIIILNSPSEYGDINLIKTLLAIMNIQRDDRKSYHIVAEVQEEKSLDIIKLITGNQGSSLLTNDIISRIIVQTSLQSGLSLIYMDLFDFSGNEIYLYSQQDLVDKNYGEIVLAHENASVIGIRNKEGKIELNPPQERLFQANEQLIIIAEDDDTACLREVELNIDSKLITTAIPIPPKSENTLILGWNVRVPSMIKLLDDYVGADSLVTVVANLPESETGLAENTLNLIHQKVKYHQGEPTEYNVLQQLNLSSYDQILLTSSDQVEPELADAQTLVTLLQLRHLTKDYQRGNQTIVTEMLDARNQDLASIAKPDDFVISERIISLIMAQIAENKTNQEIFEELLSPEGSEIYLKPITNYVIIDQPLSFYTVVASANKQNESVIGYRIKAYANNKAKNYGIVLNPPKSNIIGFNDQDQIIVISQS